MARSVALVSTWGTPARGREGKALEVFMELIVEDVKSHWYFTGDDEIQRGTQNLIQAGTTLGYM